MQNVEQMTVEQIGEEWAKDCPIDRENLVHESLRTHELHHKYYKMMRLFRRRLLNTEAKHAELKGKIEAYYTGDLNMQDLKAANMWKLPYEGQGHLTSAGLARLVAKDKFFIIYNLELGLLRERIEYLTDIVDQINRRSFNIRNAIEAEKIMLGIK